MCIRDRFADVQVGDVIQFAYDSDQLAQGRINNIKFADIAEVLDGKTYDGKKFNWEEEQDPTEDNNYQKDVYKRQLQSVQTAIK